MRRFKIRPLPTIEQILEDYEFWREKAILVHKWEWEDVRRGRRKPTVLVDGNGYHRIRIKRRAYAAHRLIWKLTYGTDPTGVIDHINGIRDDNRIENLRDVTPRENNLNRVNTRWAAECRRRREVARERKAQERARLEAERKDRRMNQAAMSAAALSLGS